MERNTMTTISVHASTSALEVLSINLSDVIALPDQEAANALNQRMATWARVEELRERSYVDRGIIAREFERRDLWKHLADPETGLPFTSFSAWMSCSDYLGCRRTNFEAVKDVKMLEADVPVKDLAQIGDKGNIKTLIVISSAARKDPAILAAAKTMDNDTFLGVLAQKHPDQHLEQKKDYRFSVPIGDSVTVDKMLAFALEHDIAGTRDEALVMAATIAVGEWEREHLVIGVFPAEEEAIQ